MRSITAVQDDGDDFEITTAVRAVLHVAPISCIATKQPMLSLQQLGAGRMDVIVLGQILSHVRGEMPSNNVPAPPRADSRASRYQPKSDEGTNRAYPE